MNQFSIIKLVLDDEVQSLLLRGTLPNSWENLSMTVTNSTLSGIISLFTVEDNLYNE